MPKLEPYSRKGDISYALGVFPALEFMKSRPEYAERLLLNPDGYENEGVAKLRALCRDLGVREEEAQRVLRRESKKDNCFAGVAFRKFEDRLENSPCHVVLCQISDQGNLGTALRTLLAFGIRDVAMVRPCVDEFDPHVLRASMGARFKLRLKVYDDFSQYRAEFPERALYPFMLDGSVSLDEIRSFPKDNYTLVFGNEQRGLPAEFAAMGQPVRIPQSEDVDSLNLAVAVAVGSYTFRFSRKDG